MLLGNHVEELVLYLKTLKWSTAKATTPNVHETQLYLQNYDERKYTLHNHYYDQRAESRCSSGWEECFYSTPDGLAPTAPPTPLHPQIRNALYHVEQNL